MDQLLRPELGNAPQICLWFQPEYYITMFRSSMRSLRLSGQAIEL